MNLEEKLTELASDYRRRGDDLRQSVAGSDDAITLAAMARVWYKAAKEIEDTIKNYKRWH